MTESEKKIARAAGDALAREIKVEMARSDIPSVRELARRVGMNHATLNERLNRSTRSGERTPMTTEELFRICKVLAVDPWDLIRRAGEASISSTPPEELGQSDAG